MSGQTPDKVYANPREGLRPEIVILYPVGAVWIQDGDYQGVTEMLRRAGMDHVTTVVPGMNESTDKFIVKVI